MSYKSVLFYRYLLRRVILPRTNINSTKIDKINHFHWSNSKTEFYSFGYTNDPYKSLSYTYKFMIRNKQFNENDIYFINEFDDLINSNELKINKINFFKQL